MIEMSPYDLTKGRGLEKYNDNFMKVRASVKKICPKCKVIRRENRVPGYL